MENEEFHAIIKLISGEEIFALISIDENYEDSTIILQNPVVIKTFNHNGNQMVKVKPWIELSNEDIFMIKPDRVLTMTESKDDHLIKIYNNFLKVRFVPERKYLRESIKDRFDDMINSGVIDEVKSIKKYLISLPIMKAHGLREILAYIDGKKKLDIIKEEITNQINQYAKRQDTWFRNKFSSDYDIIDSKIYLIGGFDLSKF